MGIVINTSGSNQSILANYPMLADAFGRVRVSQPLTLFDSSHRFDDNGLWSTATATSGTAVFNSAQGLVDLTVTAASGDFLDLTSSKNFVMFQVATSQFGIGVLPSCNSDASTFGSATFVL